MKLGLLPLTGHNIASVRNALPEGIDFDVLELDQELNDYTHLILPGVGHASKLEVNQELWRDRLENFQGYVLGICLGMQLMFEFLEEAEVKGLSLFKGKVQKIPNTEFPVPHIGWQPLNLKKRSPLLENIDLSSFYFVHSYAALVTSECVASLQYNGEWTALVQKDKWFGVQFHPEKSGSAGKTFLKNFLELSL